MSIDPFTGRNPSYCFVDLHTALDATRALLALPDVLLRGRPVKVRENTERRRTWNSAYPKPKLRKLTSLYDPALVFNRYEDRHKSREHWMALNEEARRLWISGILHHDQRQVNLDMRSLFQGWNILAVSKPIFPRPELVPEGCQPHYYCFVDFSSAIEAAEAAAALDKHSTPDGGVYKISVAGNHIDRKVMREQADIIKTSTARDLTKDWRVRS